MLQLTSLGYVVMGWIAVLFMLANIFLLELQAQTVSEAETMFRTDVMLSPPDWLTAIIRWLVNGEVILQFKEGEVVREGRFGAQFRAVVELSKGLLNCSSDKLSPDSVISMDTMGRCCFVV